MELLITATDQLTHVDGVPCRVWEGHTEEGVRCLVFVHRIAVPESEDSAAFDRELQTQVPPGRWVDLRYIL